jgi:hypothetical protein
MLKSIVAAVVSALKSIGRIAGIVSMAPLHMIDRLLGGESGYVVPPAPELAPLQDDTTDPVDNSEMYAQLANAVMAWAANSLVDDQPAALPPRLPLAVREWLPGLTRDECSAFINTDERAVSAHLRGLVELPCVRTVGRLTPFREWPPEEKERVPSFDTGSHSFVSYAAGYGLAR